MLKVLPLALLALLPSMAEAASKARPVSLYDSYDDCVNFQSLTKCTYCEDLDPVQPYGSTPYDDYEIVSCNFPGTCPDGVYRTTCNWLRYMYVYCDDDAPRQHYFGISTNGAPDHCYYAASGQAAFVAGPAGTDRDDYAYHFDVRFNIPVRNMEAYDNDVLNGAIADADFVFTGLEDSTAITESLCNGYWAVYNGLDIMTDYSEENGDRRRLNEVDRSLYDATSQWDSAAITNFIPLTNTDQIVGYAMNGVFFFAGASEFGYDAFFPKAYGNRKNPVALEVDICLGTAHTSNTYRYHMFSPCIFDISIKDEVKLCKDDALCSQDVRNYSISLIPPQLQTKLPVGIAKDGRIIYGPFKSDGTLWQPCDVDVCNGRRDRQTYYYVSTMFFPYTVGCWGPGSKAYGLAPKCSANVRRCTENSSFASGLSSALMVAFSLMSAIMLAF